MPIDGTPPITPPPPGSGDLGVGDVTPLPDVPTVGKTEDSLPDTLRRVGDGTQSLAVHEMCGTNDVRFVGLANRLMAQTNPQNR